MSNILAKNVELAVLRQIDSNSTNITVYINPNFYFENLFYSAKFKTKTGILSLH